MIEDLENRSLELTMVEDFLINLKQEFKSKCYSARMWTDFGLGLGLGP